MLIDPWTTDPDIVLKRHVCSLLSCLVVSKPLDFELNYDLYLLFQFRCKPFFTFFRP